MHRVVVALVSLIGLTGAAFVAGYLMLFAAETDRAARLAPADSAFYANVYLQPSTGQQMNLAGLIGRLPGFADEASLDEKVDQVAQNLLAETGIDYQDQIKPWLGNQLAIAAWPAAEEASADEAETVVIAEVRDREAADAAVAELVAQEGDSFEPVTYEGVVIHVADLSAYAFVEDMLVIGPADALRAVIDVSRGAPALGDREAFVETMADMPADHLAGAFVDLAAIAEATAVDDQLSGVSTAGVVLVAERDGLRLSGSAPFDMGEAPPSARAGFALGGEPSSLAEWMPADTVAELVVFGLRQTLEDAETAAASTPEGQELTSAVDTFRALAAFGLGIDLDADVLPLLDREVGLAFGGFAGELPSGQLLLRPDDPAEAAAALDRIADRLSGVGASVVVEDVDGTEVTIVTMPDVGEVAYVVTDRIVIIALGPDDVRAALDAHEAGTSLAATEAYQKTFEIAGTRAGNEAFVNVNAVVELMDSSGDLSKDARDILGQIGTFGFTAPSRDNQIEFHAVLTVEEARPE